VDITGINKDAYFEISTTKDNDSKYYVNDVTSTMTGINTITSDKETTNNNVYTIDGRQVRSNVNSADALQGLSKGIYIVNGKKYVVK
jgi:alpha-amylase